MDAFFGFDSPHPPLEGLELLTTTYSPVELMITESVLSDAKIPYIVKERGAGGLMKIVGGYSVCGSDIFVRKEHLDIARELLSAAEDGDSASEHTEKTEASSETSSDSSEEK